MKIYELSVEQFPVAEPLLSTAWFDEAYIYMVLEGIQPGRIFVDDRNHPSAALLCHPYEFYVVGDVVPALRQFITDAPSEVNIFHILYGYCTASHAWEQTILNDHAATFHRIPRRNFKYYRTHAPDWRGYLPSNASVIPIDYRIAEYIDSVPWKPISKSWGTYENFINKSYGYALFIDDSLASVCYAGAISSRYANFSVDTSELFRRQGLATLVSAAAIEKCCALNVLPTWDTDGDNLASAGLALKLGFQECDPFSQLSPQYRKNLPLSQGLWTKSKDGSTWIKEGSQ